MAKIAAPQAKSTARKTASSPSFTQDEQAQIAKIAYQFFVDRGYQHGHDAEDWARAEEIVRSKKK